MWINNVAHLFSRLGHTAASQISHNNRASAIDDSVLNTEMPIFLPKTGFYSINNRIPQSKTNNNYADRKKEGVSTATNAETQRAETHMAQAKQSSRLMAAAFVAALGAGAAAAVPGYAQEQTNTAPANVQTQDQDAEVVYGEPRHEVQVDDRRGIERDAIQTYAAWKSDNAQTIVLYGPTNETFQEVVEAATEALQRNDNGLNWIVLASGETELAIYTDGLLSHTILNPAGAELSSNIMEQLVFDRVRVEELLEGLDIAALESEASPAAEPN